jgi:phage terminase large subunit-like protein
MTFLPLNCFYQALSSKAYSKHGYNASGVIFDELHALEDRRIFDVVTRSSGMAREQPLTFIITTAGFDRNSVCWEQHTKAENILRGTTIDPTFYPVIYSAADTDDWRDPEVWRKVNPSYGITIRPDNFRQEYTDAQMNLYEENIFRRLNLNQWVKQTTRWMPMDLWDECSFPVDTKALEGKKCYAGLDLSTSEDMTAFVLVFPPDDPTDETDKFIILPFFWIPEESMQRRVLKDHVPYDRWVLENQLITTDGRVVNYNFVQQKIEELKSIYDIQELAFDRWNATQLSQSLRDAGLNVIDFGQGYKSMSPPSKDLMRLVLQQRIAHGGNPILRWNFDNIVVTCDPAGNIKPDKSKATEKIDGAVATIMALSRALVHEDHSSVYDTRSLLIYGEDGWA